MLNVYHLFIVPYTKLNTFKKGCPVNILCTIHSVALKTENSPVFPSTAKKILHLCFIVVLQNLVLLLEAAEFSKPM